MKIYYDPDIDYLEFFYQSAPNYAHDIEDGVIAFKSEKNDKIIGYAFENATKHIETTTLLLPQEKIAAMACIGRKKLGVTQEEMAQKVGISYRTYQRIEEGEITKIDDLLAISKAMKEVDFSSAIKIAC